MLIKLYPLISLSEILAQNERSSRGRVVKATDQKSVSLWERRFESYRLRIFLAIIFDWLNLELQTGISFHYCLNVKIMVRSKILTILIVSIVGSVVECSPATRAARVRFPDDASLFVSPKLTEITWQSPKMQILYYEYFCFMKLLPSQHLFVTKFPKAV